MSLEEAEDVSDIDNVSSLLDRPSESIGTQLQEHGIDKSHIVMIGKGGIADFNPKEMDRYTKVELFFGPQYTQK